MNAAVRCPICQRPAEAKFRPFCSKRCADIDLGRWFGGDYRVPGAPLDPMQADDASQNHHPLPPRRVDPDDGLG